MNHFTLKKIIFIKPQKHTQKKEKLLSVTKKYLKKLEVLFDDSNSVCIYIAHAREKHGKTAH